MKVSKLPLLFLCFLSFLGVSKAQAQWSNVGKVEETPQSQAKEQTQVSSPDSPAASAEVPTGQVSAYQRFLGKMGVFSDVKNLNEEEVKKAISDHFSSSFIISTAFLQIPPLHTFVTRLVQSEDVFNLTMEAYQDKKIKYFLIAEAILLVGLMVRGLAKRHEGGFMKKLGRKCAHFVIFFLGTGALLIGLMNQLAFKVFAIAMSVI